VPRRHSHEHGDTPNIIGKGETIPKTLRFGGFGFNKKKFKFMFNKDFGHEVDLEIY
jgi:hypothetical protein